MLRLSFFLAAFASLVSTALSQSVQINFAGGDFRDGNNTTLANGQLVLLLANVATPTTAGSGFGLLSAGTINIGDTLGGIYQVLGRTGINNGLGTSGSAVVDIAGGLFPNVSTGDQLAVAWFPSLTLASDFSLISGASYGLYTGGAMPTWQIPSAGDTLSLTVPDGVTASFSAIPEPSTYAAIAGAGVLSLALWRRRRIG